jgi:RNA polymerase sigma factor (sigma-70 family)
VTARGAGVSRAVREQVEALLDGNYKFMGSAIFRRKHIEQELFNFDVEPALPMTSWYQPTRDEGMDQAVTGAPQLMNAAEERLMFYRFNYCKVRLARLKREIRAGELTAELAKEFLEWHRKLEHFREYLVRTNLALVLAMAKRTRLGETDFAEIVSEGNMALLRAIEKFDVDRGFKFSTYACRAILKGFSRMAMKATRYRTRFPVEFEPEMEQSDWQDKRRDAVEEECIDELKAIVERNLADLSNIEQTVIRRRFNWKQTDESPLTLEEVGRIIGVTKERVRQIQNKALAKIRVVMEDGVLRVRTRTAENEEQAASVEQTQEAAEAAD